MSKKELQSYFNKAKNMPVTSDFKLVEKLVRQKGITTVSPKKWWWNVNTFIIMMTTTITSLLFVALNFSSSSAEKLYTSSKIEPNSIVPLDDSPLIYSVVLKEEFSTSEKKELKKIEVLEQLETKAWQVDPIWKKIEEPIPMPDLDITSSSVKLSEDAPTNNESRIDTNKLASNQKLVEDILPTNGVEWFELQNSKGNIRIHAIEGNQIKLQAIAEIETKKKEQESDALADFQLHLKKKGNRVLIESNWADIEGCMCNGDNKKDYIKTADGEKIKIVDLNLTYDIYLPTNINLDLKNSYANIEVPNWNADIKVWLFKASFKAGDMNNLELSNSYGKASMGSFEKVGGKLFKSELITGDGKIIDLKANYSTLKVGEVKEVELDAFQSDATFSSVSEHFNSNFRYGKLQVENPLKEAEVKAFQSKLFFDTIKTGNFNLSYSTLNAKELDNLRSQNAFQARFEIGRIQHFTGNLKYSNLAIQELGSTLVLTTFQGKVRIEKLKTDFKNLELVSKYTDLDINMDSEVRYKLNVESNYAKLDLPEMTEVVMETNHNRKNIQSVYNPEKQTDSLSEIAVNLFQGSLSINLQ